MKILKVLCLLSVSLLAAQNYRFVYEYKMKPDLEKKDSAVTDYMNLDSDGKKSYFYNAVKYERDSIYRVEKDFSVLHKSKSYDRNLNYTIEKDYTGKTVNLYDKFKNVNLVVPEYEAPVWKIHKEFVTINGVYCQKAMTDYKGRTWEAWFCKDYPISDGPYKFNGLPGLVVKVNDTENDHIFNLVRIKKVKSLYDLMPKNSRKISEREYKKLMESYTFTSEDIESIHMDSKAGMMAIQLKDGYTARFDLKELKKAGKGNIDAGMAKSLMKTNNPIEKK